MFSFKGKRGIEVKWNHVKVYLNKTDVNAILKGGGYQVKLLL